MRHIKTMNIKLEKLRKQIDKIDSSIVILLAKRMEIVKKVGKLKKKNKLPPLDNKRWKEIIRTKKGFIKKIWEIIHDEALKIEGSV